MVFTMDVSDKTVRILGFVLSFLMYALNVVSGQVCKDYNKEIPSINMCVDSISQGAPGQTIYLDSSGAPDFTKVECKCQLQFSATGSVTIKYRAQADEPAGCGITFRLESHTGDEWGCQSKNLTYTVSQSANNITYTKNDSSQADWYSCIGIQPGSNSVSLSVKCYPYRKIFGPYEVVNGGWTGWSPWSNCSCATSSMQTRTRSCTNPSPQNGGQNCQGADSETQQCSGSCTVDGNWGQWSQWSSCSKTCGDGTRSRSRVCEQPPPSNGGLPCPGSNYASESCRIAECPVDGNWGQWAQWSICSKTCGDGTRSRSRVCDQPPPTNGGLPCPGSNFASESCRLVDCPVENVTSVPPTSTFASSGPSGERPATEAIVKVIAASSNIGAIIGGIIGGLLFVLLVVLLIICFVRRRRRKDTKRRPSEGPRSVRYFSTGDDVTVTENQLYNYDGETPSHATNALFVGGIPETPSSPGYIPHFSTDTGDRYAVIMDSTRTKNNVKERPKLQTFAPVKANTIISNGHISASDTVKLSENYSDDNLGFGVENPGYVGSYMTPYDEKTHKSENSSSTSPYDYIDNDKLQRDDNEFENLDGDYARLPELTDQISPDMLASSSAITDESHSERYKRFISSEPEESPDDGYLKSPKRDTQFEFPEVQEK